MRRLHKHAITSGAAIALLTALLGCWSEYRSEQAANAQIAVWQQDATILAQTMNQKAPCK